MRLCSKMKKKILMIFLAIIVLIGLFIGLVVLFVYTAPQFGQIPEGNDLTRISSSEHYNDGIFHNNVVTNMDMHFGKMLPIMYDFMFKGGNREPEDQLPQTNFSSNEMSLRNDSNMHLRWFGHSAFYLEIDGKRILLDPMLGPAASPMSFLGAKRFNKKLPIEIENLPFIDAVIYSHDHYDHLDYESVLKLKDKVGHWYTALGMGSHLKKWGVKEENITEMDWWEEIEFEGLKFVATPARHFSGRGFRDRFKTFWNSWVIQGKYQSLYFSGDGGYSDGFKQIGEKYGPFDLCLIECGAYNLAWKDIHMMPEESAQACVDLKGRLMMPIHWGGFNLALHEWTDPIIRVSIKADELGVQLVTPIIGEELIIPVYTPNENWWLEVSD